MRVINLLIKIAVTLAVVYSLPVKTVKRSTDLDAGEITDKLSRLKNLLEKLEDVQQAKANLENKMKESERDPIEHGVEGLSQTDKRTHAKAEHDGNREPEDDIINLKMLNNVQKVKLLKELVKEAQSVKSESMVDEGTFADTAVPESKERADIVDWKDLTKRLKDETNTLSQQHYKQVKKPVHIETETKEGTFGEFRDEIKYAVEKNLLTDIALAIHSGISVDEILKDLVAEGNARSPDVVWAKRDRD